MASCSPGFSSLSAHSKQRTSPKPAEPFAVAMNVAYACFRHSPLFGLPESWFRQHRHQDQSLQSMWLFRAKTRPRQHMCGIAEETKVKVFSCSISSWTTSSSCHQGLQTWKGRALQAFLQDGQGGSSRTVWPAPLCCKAFHQALPIQRACLPASARFHALSHMTLTHTSSAYVSLLWIQPVTPFSEWQA